MRVLYSIILFLLIKTCFAQNNSLLWEISGNGLKKPSYLYGTMHLKDSRVFHFGDSVMLKFNNCKAMAGEIKMDENINPMQMKHLVMMPKDTTLDMLLSPKDYKMVKKIAKEKLGFLAEGIDHIKPVFTSALMGEFEAEKDSSEPLDQYFQTQAKKKGMKVIGIESIEEQLAAIDRVSLKEQAEMLVKSLKEDTVKANPLGELFEVYLAQDLDRMDTILQRSEMPEEMNQSLIIKRNYVMAERIDKIINTQPTFVAIGAAHLVGKEGLIHLFRSQGYTVRPVFSNYTPPKMEGRMVKKNKKARSDEWQIYLTPDQMYQVHFPTTYQEKRDDENNLIFSMETHSGNLYSMLEDSVYNESSDQFFQRRLEGLSLMGIKVNSQKQTKINGFPVMAVEMEHGDLKILMNFYYLSSTRAMTLSVTGNAEYVNKPNTKKFFQSVAKR